MACPKSLKFRYLSAEGYFRVPLARFGLHFGLLGCPFGSIVIAWGALMAPFWPLGTPFWLHFVAGVPFLAYLGTFADISSAILL